MNGGLAIATRKYLTIATRSKLPSFVGLVLLPKEVKAQCIRYCGSWWYFRLIVR